MTCTRELRDVPVRDGARQLKLLMDVVARDNCWNQPKKVTLAAGTVVTTRETQSAENGQLFFSVSTLRESVCLPSSALKTRYPYDLGVFDPDLLEPV